MKQEVTVTFAKHPRSEAERDKVTVTLVKIDAH
jgi:hypothetical protein